MPRWLGVDHGTKRIGVAVGGTADRIATPLTVLPADPPASAIEEICHLAEQYQAEGIVVGWPLNMDDTVGPQARAAVEMARQLAESTQLDVRLWDERLSSFQADQTLAGKLTRKKKKARQDAVAAAVILEDFLSHDGPETASKPDAAQ